MEPPATTPSSTRGKKLDLRRPWTLPSLEIVDVLASADARIIDLRSPSEFALDHLPGAINVPLFDDAERALIGTLYKQKSPKVAFEAGRRIVLDEIGGMVARVAEELGRVAPSEDLQGYVERLTEGGIDVVTQVLKTEPVEGSPPAPVLVHCWRGGLRSSSLVALLREIGWDDCFVLEGGYKSYRSQVMAELEAWQSPPAFILRGSTGVGKTLVLREIERLRPHWTLDLEELAGHRSSILGMVGLEPCTQKTFDSRLADRLRRGFPGQVVIEGESRKVGDSTVPPSIWSALQGGVHLRLEAPVSYRVQVLIDDYLATEASRIQLRGQLPFIEKRLGPKKWAGKLVEMLDANREAELTEILLELYYDPLYRHSEKNREYSETFDAGDVSRVASEIVDWIEQRAQ